MLLLALFAVQLGWFPTGGFEDAGQHRDRARRAARPGSTTWSLPALTLTLAYIGEYMIVDAVVDARHGARGLPAAGPRQGSARRRVRRRHAVPNALLPVVSLSALNFGFVLSGAIAVEAIFSWPGLGQATFEAIRGPDFPMLQGLFLLFSAALIVANLARRPRHTATSTRGWMAR